MQMDKGLDTGDMLAEARVSIETDETGGSLFDKLSRIGARLLVDTLPAIEAGRIIPRPQNDAQSSYAGMMKKEMGLVDWNKPAAYLERLVRGLNPWPSAYTRLNGKTLKIWATAVEQENICNTPGKVVQVTRDSIKVQTGDGLLCITEVQLEGKKRMEVKAFLLGYPVEENTLLG